MNILLGIWRVVRGRAEGMACFAGTTQSFLASLAPLIAFPIVAGLLVLLSEGVLPALDLLSVLAIAQLAPPVLSHMLAVRWGREQLWLHYATAYNWCCWAVPIVALMLMVVLGTALRVGMATEAAVQTFFFAISGYSLWLDWFIARHGLALPRVRAALLVVLVKAGTLALALGPRLLGS